MIADGAPGHGDGTPSIKPFPEWVLPAVLLLVFAAVAVLALDFEPEARLFPMIVGCTGAMLALALVIANHTDAADAPRSRPASMSRGVLIGILAAPVYSTMIWLTGFYVASPLALMILPWLLGYRNLLVLLATTVVMTAIFVGVFSYLMELSLPLGLLGTWFFNRFIYTA